jgi:hypothetical protein
MRTAFLVALLAAHVLPVPAVAARPVPDSVVRAVDGKVPIANYMPTRMLPGFTYRSWAYRNGVLRVTFRNPRRWTIVWTVEPMVGTCRADMQKSFQLAGNKIWWAEDGGGQRAWRCIFAADGIARRLSASSTTPATRLANVGLGAVVASGKRY